MTTTPLRGSRSDLTPRLRDGTSVGDLVQFDRSSVSLRTCHDPEIYELELERIFARAWIVVAHQSEITRPGDFVCRYLGEDPVIVTRTEAGEITVLLNSCAHRGMAVCSANQGNTRRFLCPYHGWAYGLDGSLRGVPDERERYDSSFSRAEHGLRRARAGVSQGWVYATFADDAPSLDDYLGTTGWFLDLLFDRTDAGLEVVGPPQRWVLKGNWKLGAEQFAGDAYHVRTAHASLMDIGMLPAASSFNMNGVNLVCADGNGFVDLLDRAEHGLREAVEAVRGKDNFELDLPLGVPPTLADEVPRHLTEEQRTLRRMYPPGPLDIGVFPNFFTVAQVGPTGDGRRGPHMAPRVFNPVGPDQMEIISWVLVEKDAPDEYKELMRVGTERGFGAGGLIEVDDAAMWEGIQHATAGWAGRQQILSYEAGNRPIVTPDRSWLPAPVDPDRDVVRRGYSKDAALDFFWRRWLEFIDGDPWTARKSESGGALDKPRQASGGGR